MGGGGSVPAGAASDADHARYQWFTPAEMIRLLSPLVSEVRLERMRAVVAERTETVVPVVEGVVNWGNVCAIMRTAEALGFLQFHIVCNRPVAKVSERTTQGADQWLDIHRWPDAPSGVRALKAEGYTVVAMHLDADAGPLENVDFTRRTALVFGNELEGVSPEMLALADRHCILPSPGFTRSFNVSVAAGMALYHAHRERVRLLGRQGDLGAERCEALLADYLVRGTDNAEAVLRRAKGAPR